MEALGAGQVTLCTCMLQCHSVVRQFRRAVLEIIIQLNADRIFRKVADLHSHQSYSKRAKV